MRTLYKYLTCLVLLTAATSAWAQTPLRKTAQFMEGASLPTKVASSVRKAPRRTTTVVTPPSGATVETYNTVGGIIDGSYYLEGNLPAIKVIVDGSDIYINGLSWYLTDNGQDSWIKGTINDDGTATFPTGQYANKLDYGYGYEYDIWIVGTDDSQTVTDIVFAFDQEAGTLIQKTKAIYENAEEDALSAYSYIYNAYFSKNLNTEVLATQKAYSFISNERSSTIYMAFDGDDVYIQRLSNNLFTAWVKGTMSDDKTITVPTGQYLGKYGGAYDMYLLGIGDALQDIVFTYNDATGQWTTDVGIYVSSEKNVGTHYEGYDDCIIRQRLTLSDSKDNSEALAAHKGHTLDVTLARTMERDKWYTLCLPFDVDLTEESSAFYGATVKTLGSYKNDGTTVTANFTDATSIEAGKPYIICLADGDNALENPTFTGAVISASTPVDVAAGTATFKGTYAPLTFASTDADKRKLFLQNNNLYYPVAETTLSAFRAYIELSEDVPADAAIKVNLGMDDDATSIKSIAPSTTKTENWYDLSGRKLNGTPAQHGIYIVNGKKVVK